MSPRKEKHGVVVRGNTATFYGRDARNFMASRSAAYCNNQKQAWAMLRDKQPDSEYALELAHWLRQFGFKIPKRFAEKLGPPHDY